MLLYKLRETGLNLRWVTADSFQSADMLQMLQQQKFITGSLSVDTSMRPYELLKTALYDGRVKLPDHERAMTELVRLERDIQHGKVDHPSNGSKDIADAIAGVCFGLTMRREIWHRYNVPPNQVPASLLAMDPQGKNALATKEKESYLETLRKDRFKEGGDVVSVSQ